jgi:uncharacterized protein (DUF3084 family)
LRVDQISAVYRRLGNSGLNPADPQLASVRAGRQLIHDKWLGRWSTAQIAEQINLAWSFYGNLEAEYLRLDARYCQLEDNHCKLQAAHRQLEDNHHQLQEAHLKLEDNHRQLEADHHQLKDTNNALTRQLKLIKSSTSYRLGRWLTAPWRWLTARWRR